MSRRQRWYGAASLALTLAAVLSSWLVLSSRSHLHADDAARPPRHQTARPRVPPPSRATQPLRRQRRHAVNVYAADTPADLSRAAAAALPRVYVPNSESNTVDAIDPSTYQVVGHFNVGALPQHVTPAYDLQTLYVNNDLGNSLTPIDPHTGQPGRPIPVDDPYNLYFTPDGRSAIVVAERLHRLDFRDPHGFRLQRSLAVPCAGVNHMDFSADGSYAIASCEFSGQLLKLDLAHRRVIATLRLPRHYTIPQDVRLSPDGRVFYVADLAAGGVWKIDGAHLRVLGFLHTGAGAHGLVVSRNARYLYVANRNAGSVSVISFRTRTVVHTWHLPGGGSPDMGGVSADGNVLWLSGRYKRRGVRDRHPHREAARAYPRWRQPPRPLRLAPTRPLLPRPHRHPPLTDTNPVGCINPVLARDPVDLQAKTRMRHILRSVERAAGSRLDSKPAQILHRIIHKEPPREGHARASPVADDREAEHASCRAHRAQRRKSPISSWRWRSVSPATVFDGAIRHWVSERAALAGPTFGSASRRS